MHPRSFALLGLLALAACPGETVKRPHGEAGASDVKVSGVDTLPWLPDLGALGSEGAPKADAPPPKADLKPAPKPDVKPPASDLWTGTNDIGKPCSTNADCQYQLCATNTHTGVKFCTKTCNRCDPQPCPAGSGCQNAGLAYICAPGYPNAPCP
jgi:hypothetical protein